MAVVVTLMIASRELMIRGSGTRSTATSFFPRQQRAFMWVPPGERGRQPPVLPLWMLKCLIKQRGLTPPARQDLLAARLSLGCGNLAGFQDLLESTHVGLNLRLGRVAD